MPITLKEIRENAAAAFQKLMTPMHPLYDHEHPRQRDRDRADLRAQARSVRRRFSEGVLVGELRKLAAVWKITVPQLNELCA